MDSVSLELSSQQAALAFERNILSLDQSLLGAIRTSLSLIGFGFAMVLFFQQMGGQMGIDLHVPARNFGLSLVVMGIGLVTVTLIEHRRRFVRLRAAMNDFHQRGLVREGFPHKVSHLALFAQLLLLIGLLVVAGVVIRIGPFDDTGASPNLDVRAVPTAVAAPAP